MKRILIIGIVLVTTVLYAASFNKDPHYVELSTAGRTSKFDVVGKFVHVNIRAVNGSYARKGRVTAYSPTDILLNKKYLIPLYNVMEIKIVEGE